MTKSTTRDDPENQNSDIDVQQQENRKQRMSLLFKSIFSKLLHKQQDEGSYNHAKVHQQLMDDLEKEIRAKRHPFWKNPKLILEIVILLSSFALPVILTVSEKANYRGHVTYFPNEYAVMSEAMYAFSGLTIFRLIIMVPTYPILRWWRLNKYLWFYVHGIKRSVDVFIWFLVLSFLWYEAADPSTKIPRLNKTPAKLLLGRFISTFFFALLFGSVLWIFKKIIILKLEADILYEQLFERIRRSVVCFHLIQMISQRGQWTFLSHCKPGDQGRCTFLSHCKPGGRKNTTTSGKNIWMNVWKMNKDTVPIWILQQLCNLYEEHLNQFVLFHKDLAFKADHMLLPEAERLFLRLIDRDEGRRKHEIEAEDLDFLKFIDMEKKEFFSMFGAEDERRELQERQLNRGVNRDILKESGDSVSITHGAFLNWAVRAFKNCLGLERTLRTSKTMIMALNKFMNIFIMIIVFLIWLLISSIFKFSEIIVVFSPLVALNMFGESSKNLLEGIIFVFSRHPFDVCDRVIIDDMQMKVYELNVMTSMFYKYDTDTDELFIYPNSELQSKKIVNFYTIPDQDDMLDFSIAEETPQEDILDLEIKIKISMVEDKNFIPGSIEVVKKEVGEGRIKMVIHFKYSDSYLSRAMKNMRKSKILTNIVEFCNQLRNEKEVTKSTGITLSSRPASKIHFQFPLEDALLPKVDQITIVKEKIERFVAGFESHIKIKVVMTELITTPEGKSEIRMAVYLWRFEEADDQETNNNQLIQTVKTEIERIIKGETGGEIVDGNGSRLWINISSSSITHSS